MDRGRRQLLAAAALASAAAALQPAGAHAGVAAHGRSSQKWLLLQETYVAGTAYYDAVSAAAALRKGMPLTLRREPNNPYDVLAVEVLSPDGRKLGYVPRVHNQPVARLLDAGHEVRAEIAHVDARSLLDIRMAVHARL